MKRTFNTEKYYKKNKEVTKIQGAFFIVVGVLVLVGIFYWLYVLVANAEGWREEWATDSESSYLYPQQQVETDCRSECLADDGMFVEVENIYGTEHFKCSCYYEYGTLLWETEYGPPGERALLEPELPSSTEECKDLGDFDQMRECLITYAIITEDTGVCKEFYKKTDIDDCLITYAVSQENLEVCDVISGWEPRETCITTYAAYNDRVDLCDTLSRADNVKGCKMHYAAINNDMNFCFTFDDEYDRGECVEYLDYFNGITGGMVLGKV
ncbi:hypothetical protein ACFL3V_04465 [Nanoarchaeota archaeon]